MTQKQHQKELARARARRQAQRQQHKTRSRTWIAVVGAIVAIAAIVVGNMLLNGDDPVTTPTTTPSADPAATPSGDATATAGDATSTADESAAAAPCPAPVDAPTPDTSMQFAEAPPAEAPAEVTVALQTSCGDITMVLNGAQAPQAVASFLFLAEQDYYVGVPFHRVMADFVIQGGDPTGTGSGGPGYQFDDELELAQQVVADNDGLYPRGTVAMANSGANTNGSQFFIVQADPGYQFPPQYVVFGEVTEGMEVVDDIANGPVTGPQQDLAVEPAIILDVVVEEA